MSETVKLPGFGEVKKSTAIVGGLGIAGVFLILWWRQRKSAQAQSAAAATSPAAAAATVTDPAGNVCSALNPATGYCPGTAEDQAALAQASGGAGLGGYYDGSGGGYYGSGGYYGGGTQGPTTPTTGSGPGPGNFSNNAQWGDAAEAALGSDGHDHVAAALGKYLTGRALSGAQVTDVEEAIAAEGQPPVPGTDGYPPSYRTEKATHHGNGGGGHDKKPAAPTGLHAKPGTDTAELSWHTVTGATEYHIVVMDGARTVRDDTSGGGSIHVGGLRPSTSYHWHVAARNTAGEGPQASASFRTDRSHQHQ